MNLKGGVGSPAYRYVMREGGRGIGERRKAAWSRRAVRKPSGGCAMTYDPEFIKAVNEFGQEYAQWKQRKRPAAPHLRSELSRMARQIRNRNYVRIAGGLPALTAEDLSTIRAARYRLYLKARVSILEMDAEWERSFWEFAIKFGLVEGGVQ